MWLPKRICTFVCLNPGAFFHLGRLWFTSTKALRSLREKLAAFCFLSLDKSSKLFCFVCSVNLILRWCFSLILVFPLQPRAVFSSITYNRRPRKQVSCVNSMRASVFSQSRNKVSPESKMRRLHFDCEVWSRLILLQSDLRRVQGFFSQWRASQRGDLRIALNSPLTKQGSLSPFDTEETNVFHRIPVMCNTIQSASEDSSPTDAWGKRIILRDPAIIVCEFVNWVSEYWGWTIVDVQGISMDKEDSLLLQAAVLDCGSTAVIDCLYRVDSFVFYKDILAVVLRSLLNLCRMERTLRVTRGPSTMFLLRSATYYSWKSFKNFVQLRKAFGRQKFQKCLEPQQQWTVVFHRFCKTLIYAECVNDGRQYQRVDSDGLVKIGKDRFACNTPRTQTWQNNQRPKQTDSKASVICTSRSVFADTCVDVILNL